MTRVDFDGAVLSLNRSQPVAIPTETVWGLAARWDDEKAINTIFELKGRPRSNPLIIHIASIETMLSCMSEELPSIFPLIEHFWPGGLTLVVPVHEGTVLPEVRAHLKTAAFRMPRHDLTQKLIVKTAPLVAPSANLSGRPSATTPEHIEHDFGPLLPILSSTTFCHHGIESTILLWQKDRWWLGRPGAIDTDAIVSVLGYSPEHHHAEKTPLCPGQLFRHYAPEAKLHLHNNNWDPSQSYKYDGVLGFSDRTYESANCLVHMGPSTDPDQITASLYTSLRDLDRLNLHSVFVDICCEHSSKWLPILDRLRKAACS